MTQGTNSLAQLLDSMSGPVFLAQRGQRSTSTVRLHTSVTGARPLILRELRTLLGLDAANWRFQVREHTSRWLNRIETVDRFFAQFGNRPVFYNPTGAVAGAQRLVDLAGELRRKLTGDLHGIYFVPRWRSVYVVLRPSRFMAGDKLQTARLRAVDNDIRACFAGRHFSRTSINVGFSMPPISAVPVDKASWFKRTLMARLLPTGTAATALTAWLGIGTVAAKSPAVPSPNAKISAAGRYLDDGGAGLVQVLVPVARLPGGDGLRWVVRPYCLDLLLLGSFRTLRQVSTRHHNWSALAGIINAHGR